ncbi:hypothetical protein [Thermomonospora cellulosilytica]|uniref:Uncharacterized protein n=1 Tax=Thermomonospora cellulosilytica TaxID=1411118 RepID=A0A7W3MVR4_9ACTN|nr:hypothetical protein [Thermomonospora cellulosilytica]MBA9002719.1 hypothetical protein [Thermomonospora cellulosilytica]
MLLGLRRLQGSRAADVAAVVGLAGLVPFVRVAVVDLIVGVRAADRAEMDALSEQYDDIPGALYWEAGPLLFQIGLFALLVLLAVGRRVPAWSPVALVLGFAALMADLDLLPLGALLFGVALGPVVRTPRRVSAASTRTG